jgi:hypothetical protein
MQRLKSLPQQVDRKWVQPQNKQGELVKMVGDCKMNRKDIMSAIASVPLTASLYPRAPQSGLGPIGRDFQAVGKALQAGDAPSAATALASLQQNMQVHFQTTASQPFGDNSQANTDYQNLVGALQTGNLSTAQKAFSRLETDLQINPIPISNGVRFVLNKGMDLSK